MQENAYLTLSGEASDCVGSRKNRWFAHNMIPADHFQGIILNVAGSDTFHTVDCSCITSGEIFLIALDKGFQHQDDPSRRENEKRTDAHRSGLALWNYFDFCSNCEICFHQHRTANAFQQNSFPLHWDRLFSFWEKRFFFSTIVNAIQGWTAQIDYPKILTGCCISFISIILMVSAFELIAWISFKKPSNQEMGHPLIQETKFVAAWEEGSQLRQQNLDLIDWETYYLMPDFEGEYVNVVNHQRVTTDQPEAYHHTIYLFGGSTMVGIEVGDSYTIPSYLQRLINDAYPNSYRVENMGVDAYSAFRQKQHLMNGVDLAPGDIVIFYDGMNDGSYAYFCCAVFEYWGTEPDPD
jgi:hypothetical protein